jgi:hypothetical protein
LADLQAAFSAMLRTPLDRGRGSLRPRAEDFSTALVEKVSPATHARARLAVYNGQYWFRLFGVFQQEFRLACALAGAWTFNELASAYLGASPPRGHDLGTAADGFAAWVATAASPLALPGGGTLPARAVAQAALIDEAFRTTFWAPPPDEAATQAFKRLSPDVLAAGRLRPSGRFVLVEEDWPLLELRHALGPEPVERPRPLPPAHPRGTAHAAITRGPAGLVVWPLERAQARLYAHLLEAPLTSALGAWEAELGDVADAAMKRVQGWLAASVERGFWAGVDRT